MRILAPCTLYASASIVYCPRAPIPSPGSHPNTSLLRARWTPARILRLSHIHHGRSIPGQLMPAACGATSVRSACTLGAERPRRTAVHIFPHTRPPDTHSHLSPQHHTPPLDRGAAVEYQGPLVNPYCTSDLCRPRGLARPPSASCDRRAFGHSTMSDPADAWFPRPRTPPAPSRKKDATYHGLLRPRLLRLSHTYGCHNSRRSASASYAWCDLCDQLLQPTHGVTKKNSNTLLSS